MLLGCYIQTGGNSVMSFDSCMMYVFLLIVCVSPSNFLFLLAMFAPDAEREKKAHTTKVVMKLEFNYLLNLYNT